MAHEQYIIVPSGFKPIHSFDMFGVLVDSWKLGEEQVRLFKEVIQREELDQNVADKVIANYRALNRGEEWTTGSQKRAIIDAIKIPLERHADLQPDYLSTLYQEGIDVLREIYEAREQALIFSTKKQEWVTQHLAPLIGNVTIPLYEWNKIDPMEFLKVGEEENSLGRRIVTHTADELPEMQAAVKSELFSGKRGKTIFVNRNNTISREQIVNEGIDYYVNSLREVGYTQLTQK